MACWTPSGHSSTSSWQRCIGQGVDVVLIAGDVYDRALPGVDVVHLLDDALVRLTAAGAKVVLTSGNHDSAIRLGFASRLLERGGVHLRTRVAELDKPLLLPLGPDAAGREAVLAIYGIPWLEPRLVAEQLGVETASHFEVTRAATDLIRADIARRAGAATVHSVVLAHTFASGGISSDSERDLSIGGVGAVPLDLFDGFSYTALGHLHGRQALSRQVRYSGSPLAYSFSEATHRKGRWLVDLGPGRSHVGGGRRVGGTAGPGGPARHPCRSSWRSRSMPGPKPPTARSP